MIPRRPLAAAALLATAAAALLAAASVPAPAGAHSTIAWPTPTHKSDCSFIPGRKMKCLGRGQTACPRTQRPAEAGKNWRQPAATWARGQQVTLRYKKNNHGPVGFVRWSLVPAKLHYSNAAHTKFAFWWNCWGSGFHDCRGDECGTDDKRKAWASQVTIPTSIPDGNYVLGFGTLGEEGGGPTWAAEATKAARRGVPPPRDSAASTAGGAAPAAAGGCFRAIAY